MAIRRNNGVRNKVDKVIDILRNLGQLSLEKKDVENLDLILSLTNSEITEIKRWLEMNNPGAAELMFELRRSMSNDFKFDARMMMIGIFYFMAEQKLVQEPPKQKLRKF